MRQLVAAGFLAGLFAIPTAAFAVTFSELDANGDGAVSLEEFQAALPDNSEADFNEIDANGDKAISPEELAAAG